MKHSCEQSRYIRCEDSLSSWVLQHAVHHAASYIVNSSWLLSVAGSRKILKFLVEKIITSILAADLHMAVQDCGTLACPSALCSSMCSGSSTNDDYRNVKATSEAGRRPTSCNHSKHLSRLHCVVNRSTSAAGRTV
jgi:hypothetical protein